MINVKVLKKENIYLGFKIEGHAVSRQEIENALGDAYDLICNSVSVLSQSVIIGMVEVLKLPIKYDINDGFLSLNISNLNHEDILLGQVLLETFYMSMVSVKMSLEASLEKNKANKYITLNIEEV